MYLLIFIQTAPSSLCQGQWDNSFEDAHSLYLHIHFGIQIIPRTMNLIWIHTFCVNYPPIVPEPGRAINCVNHSSIPTDFTPFLVAAPQNNEKMGFLSLQTDAIDVIT